MNVHLERPITRRVSSNVSEATSVMRLSTMSSRSRQNSIRASLDSRLSIDSRINVGFDNSPKDRRSSRLLVGKKSIPIPEEDILSLSRNISNEQRASECYVNCVLKS